MAMTVSNKGLSSTHLATKTALEHERRDVKDLWNDALRSYTKLTGYKLEPKFIDVAAIQRHGSQQLEEFSKGRHNGSKADKIRSLLTKNIDFIEAGAKQIVSAASAAFPPAVAIGTAFHFMLAGCKSVRDDFNLITAFFEDMQMFLQQVSILERRLPQHKAYQARLTDVFASILVMCGLATKCLDLGRFKKWIINSFMGQDPELADGRTRMTTALTNLQSATEFAILGNTEDIVKSQADLQQMQEEMSANQKRQLELASSQQSMLQSMSEEQQQARIGIETIRDDIKEMFEMLKQKHVATQIEGVAHQAGAVAINRIKSICPVNFENDQVHETLTTAHIEGTCQWLFRDPSWQEWCHGESSNLLAVEGPSGCGKSHLALATLQHVQNLAAQALSGSIITAFFFARENIEALQTWESFVRTLMLHVSEQSPTLRKAMESQLSRDGVPLNDEDFLMEHVILPFFHPTSDRILYIMVDEVSLMDRDYTLRDKFRYFLKDYVRRGKYRVKVLCTIDKKTRLIAERLQVQDDNMREDLKELIRHGLSEAGPYSDLSRLNSNIKLVLSHEIERVATQPLYTEQIMQYLNSIGRPGKILEELSQGLPPSTNDIYDKLLKRCELRLPTALFKPVTHLLSWMSCCKEPLTLKEANDIVSMSAPGMQIRIDNEIAEIFSAFVKISNNDAHEGTSQIALSEHREINLQTLLDSTAHEDNSIVAFRSDSLRRYFRAEEVTEHDTQSIRSSLISNCITVFLDCCKLLTCTDPCFTQFSGSRLQAYAMRYCLRHWQDSPMDEPELLKDRAREVFEAFAGLFADRDSLATLIENGIPGFIEPASNVENLYTISRLVYLKFLIQYDEYARWLKGLASHSALTLGDDARAYWQEDEVLLPLSRRHWENWSRASDEASARRAYAAARRALRWSNMKDLIHDYDNNDFNDFLEDTMTQFCYTSNREAHREELYKIRDAFALDSTVKSHFAVAVVLAAIGDTVTALEEVHLADETCANADRKAGNYAFRATIYYRAWLASTPDEKERSAIDTVKHIDSAMELLPEGPHKLTVVPLLMKAHVLENLATTSYDTYQFLIGIYESLRLNRVYFRGKLSLWSEWNLYVLCNDEKRLLWMFLKLKPLQRLRMMLDGYSEAAIHHAHLMRAVQSEGNSDKLLKAYLELVDGLAVEGLDALWRPYLADLQWRVKDDVNAAQQNILQALDTNVKGQVYAVTSTDAGIIAIQLVNMVVDLLYQQFRKHKDIDQKRSILEECKSLMSKPLTQAVQINSTSTVPYLITVGKMAKRLGSMDECQSYMQEAFDICWANLHDDFVGNDLITLHHFSKLIASVDTMQQQARTLSSSQLSYTGKMAEIHRSRKDPKVEDKSVEEDESSRQAPHAKIDFYSTYVNIAKSEEYNIDGATNSQIWCTNVFCKNGWDEWISDGQLHPMYTCLNCPSSTLCEGCCQVAVKRKQEGLANARSAVELCCDDGRYMKTPIEGWQGIKDGVIEIEGEEPVEFEAFLLDVRDNWRQYWSDVWLG